MGCCCARSVRRVGHPATHVGMQHQATKLHSRLGVAAVLAADAQVQAGARLAAALHRNLDQLAHAAGVQLLLGLQGRRWVGWVDGCAARARVSVGGVQQAEGCRQCAVGGSRLPGGRRPVGHRGGGLLATQEPAPTSKGSAGRMPSRTYSGRNLASASSREKPHVICSRRRVSEEGREGERG